MEKNMAASLVVNYEADAPQGPDEFPSGKRPAHREISTLYLIFLSELVRQSFQIALGIRRDKS
jgi:hypothetical protein